MSLNNWIEQRLSLNPALDGTTTPIGGGPSTTTVNGALLGEIFFKQSADVDGGNAREQRQKWFITNTHPTESLTDGKLYIANGLDAWGVTNAAPQAQSSHPDDNDLKVRFVGRDTNGDPIQYEINLEGTTLITSPDTMTELTSAELRDQDTGVLQGGQGQVDIYQAPSVLLGSIPPSFHFATTELQIWLPSTLDDTGTAVDTYTNPSGASWSAPRTIDTALSVANSGTLTAGASQGVWGLWTLPAGTRPRDTIQFILGLVGGDSL